MSCAAIAVWNAEDTFHVINIEVGYTFWRSKPAEQVVSVFPRIRVNQTTAAPIFRPRALFLCLSSAEIETQIGTDLIERKKTSEFGFRCGSLGMTEALPRKIAN